MKFIRCLMVTAIAMSLLFGTLTAAAQESGKSYTYDYENKPVPVPDPYTAALMPGSGKVVLDKPEGMAVYNDQLFVLDSGNKRVIVFDTDFQIKNEISFTKDGKPYEVLDLKGICIDNRGLFIADSIGGKVFLSDFSGNVTGEYFKPDSELLTEQNVFRPLKVLTDSTGQLYVLVENEYRGAMSISTDGKFNGFYGVGKIPVTAAVLLDDFWSNFLTEAQKESARKYLPMNYTSFARDKNDFIYAVQGAGASGETLRKMNAQGANVLKNQGIFGDLVLDVRSGKVYNNSFVAVTVDDDGFITVLDNAYKRIFQYDSEGTLLYIFGGEGTQSGTFADPVDLVNFGGRILVLDREYGRITVFKPTEFAENVRNGVLLYQEGRFIEAVKPWQRVLELDGNYRMAYNSIGKSLIMEKKYAEAMTYFKIADSRGDYSLAFQRYRKILLRERFAAIAVIAAVVMVLILVLRKLFRKKYAAALTGDRFLKLRYLFNTVLHPTEHFAEMRYNANHSYKIGAVIFGLYGLMNIIKYFLDGFIFNTNRPGNFNLVMSLFSSWGLLLIFILVNWLLTSFFEGKATLGMVFIIVSYALVPVIVSQAVTLLLSNLLVLEEGVFIGYIIAIGYIWAGYMIFSGMSGLHMYSFKQNIASVTASLVGIMVILFLCFLMFSLFAQVAGFAEVLIKEITYRSRSGF